MALICEAFYEKQSEAKQRNAEPALKGWFSGFGKTSAREEPWPQKSQLSRHFTLKQKIIPAIKLKFNQIILT
jgi:hypothetical protein